MYILLSPFSFQLRATDPTVFCGWFATHVFSSPFLGLLKAVTEVSSFFATTAVHWKHTIKRQGAILPVVGAETGDKAMIQFHTIEAKALCHAETGLKHRHNFMVCYIKTKIELYLLQYLFSKKGRVAHKKLFHILENYNEKFNCFANSLFWCACTGQHK